MIGAIIYCVSLLKPLADEEVYHNYAISRPDKRNKPGDNFLSSNRIQRFKVYIITFSHCASCLLIVLMLSCCFA